jgi:hypothetical protein
MSALWGYDREEDASPRWFFWPEEYDPFVYLAGFFGLAYLVIYLFR